MPATRKYHFKHVCVTGLVLAAYSSMAQDLDPRRWSPLPLNVNYAGLAYLNTRGDVSLDPVLELDDVEVHANTIGAKFLRSFELLNHSARAEFSAPYQYARWSGLLQGEPASTKREGFADPQVRFAINLVGAPPMKRDEFVAYNRAHPVSTTVGAGLMVSMPFGEYHEEKLLNLGENRFVIRPEFGVEHRRDKWLTELTVTASLFTENDEFYNGNSREQEPYYSATGLLSYTFRPGLWVGTGIGYGLGGESSINNVDKDDAKANFASGLVLGIPINRTVGIKFACINNQALEDTGTDSTTFSAAVSMLW